jgi:hypothetical protein
MVVFLPLAIRDFANQSLRHNRIFTLTKIHFSNSEN